MDDLFKIIISHLKDGQTEKIRAEAPPSFLEVDEPELSFDKPVRVSGDAYIAGEELVLHLNAGTTAIIPCSICTRPVALEVTTQPFYHIVPLGEIKGNEYNFGEIIRENLLIEVPSFTECEGNCPERENIKNYLKPEGESEGQDEGQQPFSHLSL